MKFSQADLDRISRRLAHRDLVRAIETIKELQQENERLCKRYAPLEEWGRSGGFTSADLLFVIHEGPRLVREWVKFKNERDALQTRIDRAQKVLDGSRAEFDPFQY